MAHEIENEMIAYSNDTPWHGIGTRLDVGSTPAEFLTAAKLDWTVDPYPLTALVDGESVAIDERMAFIRSSDHKVMTFASPAWQPLQNADCLEFMRRYCEAGGAVMETAGALRDGKIVWGLARLNHSFDVRPGDKVNGYILITSPHIVGSAIKVQTTTVRVVCANTMAMAELGSTVEYKQNHMSEFDVGAAKAAIEAAHDCLAKAEQRAKTIDRLKLSLEDTVKRVLVPVFSPALALDGQFMAAPLDIGELDARLQGIIDSMQNAPGAIEGTGWGALNGVTHYCDHVAGRSPATRMMRSWLGDHGRNKLEVERRLIEMAG